MAEVVSKKIYFSLPILNKMINNDSSITYSMESWDTIASMIVNIESSLEADQPDISSTSLKAFATQTEYDEFIQNFDSKKNSSSFFLGYLGRVINSIANADKIIFYEGWASNISCILEYSIASYFGISKEFYIN